MTSFTEQRIPGTCPPGNFRSQSLLLPISALFTLFGCCGEKVARLTEQIALVKALRSHAQFCSDACLEACWTIYAVVIQAWTTQDAVVRLCEEKEGLNYDEDEFEITLSDDEIDFPCQAHEGPAPSTSSYRVLDRARQHGAADMPLAVDASADDVSSPPQEPIDLGESIRFAMGLILLAF
mmetsp:Transcript_2548/g.4350  ORF Transcript_2548/g.4350 Transcript_2548/m.4350 type:complete len:180 (-) Transcript_2548:173-712(-)